MKTENPNRGEKYHDLAQQFADDFKQDIRFSSDQLTKWAKEHGYPRNNGVETNDEHARRIVRYLRMASDHSRMGDKAFRIVNQGWHSWKKEELDSQTVRRLQKETYMKMSSAASNGQRRNSHLAKVLLNRNLPPNEAMIVAFSPQAYAMLQTTLVTIEENLNKLFDSFYGSVIGQQEIKQIE